MNIGLTYGIIAVILLIAEQLYFKIADKYNIIDKPNERSSHSTIVLRGGDHFCYINDSVGCADDGSGE